ncbi:aldose 1-epimerase family protein [Corynebacterium pseudopelargi]|uniref:Aldose 1-epimerase n=1 Tax=Corynebacterium pseudopelargi TaxID=2080757 RepID=A0A3G6IUZ9_9CORY|nr:aldose 1-epimerase family protein [Corynebacterium pseudopelargi]AZA09522.1 Aldose 1-epimerase [Corynebacterium pseudopelargi]
MEPAKTSLIELNFGDYHAEVNLLGGGLKALTYRGYPLVETYEDPSDPPLAAGLILAPWPNRVEDGQFSFEGQSYQLEISEPDRNNAIHGLVHNLIWSVVQRDTDSVVLRTEIPQSPGWPWQIELQVRYSLSEDGLELYAKAEAKESVAPFAFGWHSYLNCFGEPTDALQLEINVDEQLPLDSKRNLPSGSLTRSPIVSDLQAGVGLSGLVFDDCFTAPGGVNARLTGEHGAVMMRCSSNLGWAQIFTPDESLGVTYPGRGRAVAIEPMSAPPNALHDDVDVEKLLPGSPIEYRINISAA